MDNGYVSQMPSRTFPLAQERFPDPTNRHSVTISPAPGDGLLEGFKGPGTLNWVAQVFWRNSIDLYASSSKDPLIT